MIQSAGEALFKVMLGKPQSKPSGITWGLFYIPGTTRTTGIFVTDEVDYIFSAFLKVLADEKKVQLPSALLSDPDAVMDNYVKNYDAVVVLKDPEGMVLRRKQVLDTTYADPAPIVAARPVATKPPVAEAAAPPAKAAPRINSLSDIKLHSLFE